MYGGDVERIIYIRIYSDHLVALPFRIHNVLLFYHSMDREMLLGPDDLEHSQRIVSLASHDAWCIQLFMT